MVADIAYFPPGNILAVGTADIVVVVVGHSSLDLEHYSLVVVASRSSPVERLADNMVGPLRNRRRVRHRNGLGEVAKDKTVAGPRECSVERSISGVIEGQHKKRGRTYLLAMMDSGVSEVRLG